MTLMCLCARSQRSGVSPAQVQTAIDEGIDWGQFGSLVEAHRVLPLVYSTFQRVECAIPGTVADLFKLRYLQNIQYCLQLVKELTEISEAFSCAAIDVMPLKGPVLAQTLYANIALRQSGDLDLLVRTSDFDRAANVLADLGYSTPMTDASASVSDQQTEHEIEAARTGHHVFKNAAGTIVELHKAIGVSYLPFGLNNDKLWSVSRPVDVFGHSMFVLPPLYNLLFLIHHGSKHAWSCLNWLCDISEFVRAFPNTDWSELFREAKRLRMQRMTYTALLAAAEILSCPVPENVLTVIRNDSQARSLVMFIGNLHRNNLNRDVEDRHGFAFNFKVMDSYVEALRYVLLRFATPTPKEWAFIKLPHYLMPLYALVRPIRIAIELIRQRRREN